MERLVHKALNGENDGKYSGKKNVTAAMIQ